MGRTIEQWLEVLGETAALDEEAGANLRQDLEQAKEKTDALQKEFDALNHMLTHQPPSAWAKREKKYHDDKKLWDSAQAELTGKVKRLNEEVRTLKDNNRAVILQEQLQEAEASYKELKKEHEDVNKKLADKTAAHKSLLEEHAKISKAHQEAVQESVTARMSMRKLEEALAKKTSEAVAEQSKAAESSRLLSSLRRDFNESSLKSDGLKEQLEALRAAQAATQKKMAGEIDALNKEVQVASEKASAEAASHAAAAAQIAELSGQLQSLRAQNGEVNETAKEAEQERADEAKKALAKLNDMHQAELTAVKRQLIGLEDRCQSLMNERTTLQKQLRSARTEHDAALRAAKTAAAAAAAGVSEEAAVDAALSAAAGARAAAASPARKVSSSWNEQDAAGVLRAPGSRSPSPRARASPARTASDAASPDAKAGVPCSASGDVPGTVPEARDAIEAKGATLPVMAPEGATSPLKAQASAVSVDTGGVVSVSDAAAAAGGGAASAGAQLAAGAVPAAAAPDAGSPDAAVPSADEQAQLLTAEALEARDSAEASAPLMLDMPALQINTTAQADMSKPENISISAQMDAWQHACGMVLPPAERAALIASGHAQVLSDTLSALDRENAAHAQARMRACACKIASSVPMASRPTEYSGGQILPPKMGLPKSGMTVLRAAARARADRAMVADEMDAEAVAREAAGEAAIASAFARAMAADDAHTDRRLVAVANAVALSEGTGHNGQPLSRERIGLLRAAALRSSDNAKAWKGLPADEDFLQAFSVAMVSSSVPLPSGDVISIAEEQRLLFQAAGAAVLGADGDAHSMPHDLHGGLHRESSGGAEGDSEGDGLAATRSLQQQQSFAVQRDASGQLDLSSLPNNATGRALREYAAQCETTVQVHQAQVEQLNRQLADKDKELAAMEESLDILAPVDSNGERALKGNLSAADAQRLEALQECISSGSTKQASRIKSLEANLIIAEQNLSNCKARLKDMGMEDDDVAALTNPSAADTLILSGNEDNYLTTLVVKLKVDLAETHGELMHCKRALTRAKESETKLLEKVAMLEVPLTPAHNAAQPRRTSLFTPRMNILANNAVAEVPEETEPPVDTQAHDELSAPEINIGDGVTRELDEDYD